MRWLLFIFYTLYFWSHTNGCFEQLYGFILSIVDTAGSVLIHKAGNHTFTKFNGQGFPFVSQKDLLEIYVKNDAMQANLRRREC